MYGNKCIDEAWNPRLASQLDGCLDGCRHVVPALGRHTLKMKGNCRAAKLIASRSESQEEPAQITIHVDRFDIWLQMHVNYSEIHLAARVRVRVCSYIYIHSPHHVLCPHL